METMIEQPQTMTERAVQELSTFNDMISAVLPYGEFTVAVDGIGKVEEAHKQVKKLHAAIEAKREDLKRVALDYGKTVDSIATQLKSTVKEIESKLKAERDAFDAIEKAEKAAKEAAKQAAKQKRLDDMVAFRIPVDLAAADLPDEEWMWWFSKAKKQVAELEERIADERRQAEAFEAAQRKEREELAAKMAEETKRQAEELRVRAEEVERQRLADEAVLRAEREAMEAQRKATEAKAAEERRQMEAEREELRRQQDEIRKAAEVKAAEERRSAEAKAEEIAKAERLAKMLALQPEIEKAEAFCEMLKNQSHAWFIANGEQRWTDIAVNALNWACRDIITEVKK